MRELDSHAIMIVEDDADVRAALAEVLEEQGYLVICASDGREAVEKLRDCEICPSLIIVDQMLPGLDGRALCSILKQDADLAGIPLVVISADQRLGEQMGDLEADAYITKPLDMGRLLNTIEAHVPMVS